MTPEPPMLHRPSLEDGDARRRRTRKRSRVSAGTGIRRRSRPLPQAAGTGALCITQQIAPRSSTVRVEKSS